MNRFSSYLQKFRLILVLFLIGLCFVFVVLKLNIISYAQGAVQVNLNPITDIRVKIGNGVEVAEFICTSNFPSSTPTPNIIPTLTSAVPSPSLEPPTITTTPTPIDSTLFTPQNFKVAFLGDSGSGNEFQKNLDMIKAEGADLVLHQGDMDYVADKASAQLFQSRIDNTIPNIPYLASDGNHDDWSWYKDYFKGQLGKMGFSNVDPSSSNYTLNYKGLKLVFAQENGNPSFIDNALKNDQQVWKICSWHKNQTAMQLGDKSNEQGWPDYETCFNYGAIVATGHEHSYSRTRTLLDVKNQTVDPTCGDRDHVCVEPGKSFVFVNGLGGKSIRVQKRCLPAVYPYGCNQEWASIYTSDQNAEYGVLFVEFYVDNDPRKASAYFKNQSGQIIDQFIITSKN